MATIEIVKEAEKEIIRHLRAWDPIASSLASLKELLKIYSTVDEITKSALFSSVITQYGRAFVANKKKGVSETYRLKELQQKIKFDQDVHREIITLRNQFIAHQDWEVSGKALARSTFEGEINSQPVKVILEHSAVVTSLMYASEEKLLIWQTHIENVYKGLSAIIEEVLSSLVNLGVTHPDLFHVENPIVRLKSEPFNVEMTKESAVKIPSIESLGLPKELVEVAGKVIGDGYVYRYARVSKNASGKKINEGGNNEITITLNRK